MSEDGGERERAESIGGYLARQRRLRGISIDELCERTKIPRRNLERLEAGAFDASPDGFARGFVRTVAQALGLDADEAVMRLMREPDPDDEAPGGVSPQTLLLRFAAVALVVGLALALWSAGALLLRPSDPVAPPAVVLRPDPVRRLAEGLAASDAPAAETAVEPAAETAREPAAEAP